MPVTGTYVARRLSRPQHSRIGGCREPARDVRPVGLRTVIVTQPRPELLFWRELAPSGIIKSGWRSVSLFHFNWSTPRATGGKSWPVPGLLGERPLAFVARAMIRMLLCCRPASPRVRFAIETRHQPVGVSSSVSVPMPRSARHRPSSGAGSNGGLRLSRYLPVCPAARMSFSLRE